jgi:hypothetical protein
VRYDADGDCHVHLLDADHHHSARGDREMAWRLQSPAQATSPRPRLPEASIEDLDVSSAASPWAYSGPSSEVASGSGAKSGGEGGGAGGADAKRSAAMCDSAADSCFSDNSEKRLGGHPNAFVVRTARRLEPTSPGMVSFWHE